MKREQCHLPLLDSLPVTREQCGIEPTGQGDPAPEPAVELERLRFGDSHAGWIEPPIPPRSECRAGPRPCPHTNCSSHLWARTEPPGRRHPGGKRPPHLVVPHDGETCAQDLVELGTKGRHEAEKNRMWSKAVVGMVLGVSTERVRQIEVRAMEKQRIYNGFTEFLEGKLDEISPALERSGYELVTKYPVATPEQVTFERDPDEGAMYVMFVIRKRKAVDKSGVIRRKRA